MSNDTAAVAAFGVTEDQARVLFRGVLKHACYIIEEQPAGAAGHPAPPASAVGAGRREPSELVQVVTRTPQVGHEGRGASPPTPPGVGFQAAATDVGMPKLRTLKYTPGTLAHIIKESAAADLMQRPPEPSAYVVPDDYPIELRIRAGRTAVGHLPAPPGVKDRLRERPMHKGDVQRVLEEKTAQGITPLESIAAGAIAQSEGEDEPEVPEGADKVPFQVSRAGSLLDYAGRAALGVGLGKTIGSLAKGPARELMERRLGLTGALLGLSLAAASHREHQRHQEARKILRETAERERGELGSGRPLQTADEQMRSLLESGARAEGIEGSRAS